MRSSKNSFSAVKTESSELVVQAATGEWAGVVVAMGATGVGVVIWVGLHIAKRHSWREATKPQLRSASFGNARPKGMTGSQ